MNDKLTYHTLLQIAYMSYLVRGRKKNSVTQFIDSLDKENSTVFGICCNKWWLENILPERKPHPHKIREHLEETEILCFLELNSQATLIMQRWKLTTG